MTLGNNKSGPEMAQSGPDKITRRGKDHTDFWKQRLFIRSYEWNGDENEIPGWQVRIAHRGRRARFQLGTSNKDAAAKTARDIYMLVRSSPSGWDLAFAKYKPDMLTSKDGCTVGDFLSEVQATSSLKPQTFAIYARKFRTLVAGVCKIEGGKEKHDYVNGGYKAWLAKVHAVKLDKLTPDRINEWKVRELKEVANNPAQRKQTSTTVRSIMLSAKSLFTADIRKHLTIKLPTPLPFDGVTLPEIGKFRYKGLGGNLTPALLAQAARKELAKKRPEEYKAFLLAFGAGLRRDEVDGLEWSKIRWTENKVRVESTEHSGTKSDTSEADINVDPGLLAILKGYMPKPSTKASQFVIASPVAPKAKATTYHHYRADRVFKNLIKWLRSKGVASRNPIHTLRKEFGSQICKQAGIFAASVALRHSGIAITREHYVADNSVTAVFHISKLFNEKAA